MAEHDELKFWQTQRDEGRLMIGVQLHRDRAILFFGAYAVFAKDENELLEILEAHEVVAGSEEELLQGLSSAPDAVAARLKTETFVPSDEQVEKVISRFTQGYMAAVRKSARQKLQHALGKGFDEA